MAEEGTGAHRGPVHATEFRDACPDVVETQSVKRRRLVSLMLAPAMLHLSALQVDAACAQHSQHVETRTTIQHVSADPADHYEHSPTAGGGTCNTPVVPECCHALATCSVTLSASDGCHLRDSDVTHAGEWLTTPSPPPSRNTSPDPPPPRL